MDLFGNSRPVDFLLLNVKLPSANTGHLIGLLQQLFGLFQVFFKHNPFGYIYSITYYIGFAIELPVHYVVKHPCHDGAVFAPGQHLAF